MNQANVNARIDRIVERAKAIREQEEKDRVEALDAIVEMCLNALENNPVLPSYAYFELPKELFHQYGKNEMMLCNNLNDIFGGRIIVNHSTDNGVLELSLRVVLS